MCKFLPDVPFVDVDEVLVTYLAKKGSTNKQKMMVEKNFDNLTAEDVRRDWKAVEAGMRKEILSLHENKTFIRQSRKTARNILTARWVHKYKLIDGIKEVKSRMTVRGFQDLGQEDMSTFAGTASRWGQRLVVSIAAQRQWSIFMWDVSVAFLQGLTFSQLAEMQGTQEREVCFEPPKGSEPLFQELPGMESFNPAFEVLRMLKAIYGLKDAPRAWKLQLERVLRLAGGAQLHTDKNLWIWFRDSCLVLIISSHVDDMKGAFQSDVFPKVKAILVKEFGALKEAYDNFTHCGIEHVTDPVAKTISLHQEAYVKQLKLMDHVQLAALATTALLDFLLLAQFQSLLGALSWLTQTRMDVCIYVCALQRAAKQARVEHALRLNKVAKWVRRKASRLIYKVLGNPVRIQVISDAAFRKEDSAGLAIRGAVIAIVQSIIGSPGGLLHVLEWYSRKQRRVTRSTYSAELNALADAVDFGKLMAMTLSEVLRPFPNAPDLTPLEEQGKFLVPLEACVDARSVYDSLKMDELKAPTEVSLIMMLSALKEALLSHGLHKLWWISTQDMVADGLNKGACSREALIALGTTGQWKLMHACLEHTEHRYIPVVSALRTFMNEPT